MSRSRKSATGDALATVAPAEKRRAQSAGSGIVWRMVASAVFLWTVALTLMALLTANPVLVSGDQIRRSDDVVIARFDDDDRRRVEVERVLFGDLAPGDTLTVVNLDEVSLRPRAACLLPLTRQQGDFAITTLEGQQSSPLLYPAAPQTIDQVREILRAK
ncbi:MAG: hypothetical protein ACT4QC_09985 [Planctomycetaceae bacterium]